MNNMYPEPGKLIVIEGVDSAGKATQTALLVEALRNQGIEAITLTYPDYAKPTGVTIKDYLNGRWGDPVQVNPYMAGNLYVLDRVKNRAVIAAALDAGIWVILDRYSTSNAGFQGAKLIHLPESWDDYVQHNHELEHGSLDMPVPDRILFLDVPPAVSKPLSEKRQSRSGEDGKEDGHESNVQYLQDSYDSYWRCLTKGITAPWSIIQCLSDDNNMLPKETIRGNILETLKDLF